MKLSILCWRRICSYKSLCLHRGSIADRFANNMERIRKFGPQHCDLPTMLWNVTVLLRALTLNIDKRHTARIPLIFYIFTATISFSYFYVYLVSVIYFVFVKCVETGNIIAALVAFSLGISSEIGTSKLIFMFLYIDVVRDLVEGYLECDSLVIPGSRFAKSIHKTLKIVKKRAIIFWIVIIGNGIAYATKPLLMNIIFGGRHLMEDTLIIYGLEPMFESPNYEISFCLTACGIIFTVYLPSNITAFLIVITGYTEAQMHALSEEICQVWEDAEKNYRKNHSDTNSNVRSQIEVKNRELNNYVRGELADIAKKHMTNISLIQKIETVFCGAVAIEFMLLIMGLIAELLGGLQNTYIEVPFALMQVAMDCLVGQRLVDASITFENAVYDSKWENFDIPNRRTVLLMLQNAQKTLTLSAGGITMLNFISLMAVMKSIYSMYTTLRSTMNIK